MCILYLFLLQGLKNGKAIDDIKDGKKMEDVKQVMAMPKISQNVNDARYFIEKSLVLLGNLRLFHSMSKKILQWEITN